MLQFLLIICCLTAEFFLTGEVKCTSIQEASIYPFSQQHWDIAFDALKKVSFKGSEQVLDVGCGNGKITANIAGRVPKGTVIGLDERRGMLAFANKNYLPFYSNLSFIQGNIFDFLPPHQFDLIFSSSSLYWILDHRPLLVQVHELLADQGTLLFTIPSSLSAGVAAVFRDIVEEEPWQSLLKDYFHSRRKFSSEEYTSLLKQAGFRKIDVIQVPFTYYFETKREFAFWFADYSLMLPYIPNEMRRRFLSRLVERYLESFPLDKSGRVVFQQNELVIKAQK